MSATINGKSSRTLVKGALATVLIGLGLTACQPAVPMNPGSASSAGAAAPQAYSGPSSGGAAKQARPGPSGGAPVGAGAMPAGGGPGENGSSVRAGMLQAMPTGSVFLQQSKDGSLVAKIDLFGLTPGSSHVAAIEAPGVTIFSPAVSFGVFTADATGQVHTTLVARQSGRLPDGSRFSIHLGTFGGDFNRNQVAMELIARTDPLPALMGGSRSLPLHAVSFDANGNDLGTLSGREKVTYDPAAHTLSVTVTAHGLASGAHAAHIHVGSCQVQGGVKYMLPDFQADSQGDIVDETRTVANVMSAPPASGWYLNLHQGDMNSILSNGAPALSFRPLLCADLGPVATVPGGHAMGMPADPAVGSGGSQDRASQDSSASGGTTDNSSGVNSTNSMPGMGASPNDSDSGSASGESPSEAGQ